VDDRRQRTSHATILAESGRIVDGPNGPRVLMENGTRQEVDKTTGRLNILAFRENVIDLAQSVRADAARARDMSEVGIRELLNPPPGVAQPRDIPRWKVEAHKRLATPLTALSYTLVALVAVLTGTFRRHGGVLRPAIGIGAVVVLLAAGLALGNLAVRHLSLLPLLWVHALLPAVVCGWWLFGPTPHIGWGTDRANARRPV
jgi:lipopolysaccharide export system permease protein